VREIAKGSDATVSYIKWDPTSQSSCSGISQRDHLKPEAAFARAALEMKYRNPIKPQEKTEAGGSWSQALSGTEIMPWRLDGRSEV